MRHAARRFDDLHAIFLCGVVCCVGFRRSCLSLCLLPWPAMPCRKGIATTLAGSRTPISDLAWQVQQACNDFMHMCWSSDLPHPVWVTGCLLLGSYLSRMLMFCLFLRMSHDMIISRYILPFSGSVLFIFVLCLFSSVDICIVVC